MGGAYALDDIVHVVGDLRVERHDRVQRGRVAADRVCARDARRVAREARARGREHRRALRQEREQVAHALQRVEVVLERAVRDARDRVVHARAAEVLVRHRLVRHLLQRTNTHIDDVQVPESSSSSSRVGVGVSRTEEDESGRVGGANVNVPSPDARRNTLGQRTMGVAFQRMRVNKCAGLERLGQPQLRGGAERSRAPAIYCTVTVSEIGRRARTD